MYQMFVTERTKGASPATYADERNLCLKRRNGLQVKSVEALDQKVMVQGSSFLGDDENYPKVGLRSGSTERSLPRTTRRRVGMLRVASTFLPGIGELRNCLAR